MATRDAPPPQGALRDVAPRFLLGFWSVGVWVSAVLVGEDGFEEGVVRALVVHKTFGVFEGLAQGEALVGFEEAGVVVVDVAQDGVEHVEFAFGEGVVVGLGVGEELEDLGDELKLVLFDQGVGVQVHIVKNFVNLDERMGGGAVESAQDAVGEEALGGVEVASAFRIESAKDSGEFVVAVGVESFEVGGDVGFFFAGVGEEGGDELGEVEVCVAFGHGVL